MKSGLKQEDFLDDLDLNDPLDNESGIDDDFDLDGSLVGGEESSTPLDRHNDLLKELSDFDTSLTKVFQKWLGLRWDESSENFVKNEYTEPLMNIKGAEWCLTFLFTYARRNNILTDIGKDQFKYIEHDMIDVIFMNIIPKKKDFDIKDNGDALLIATQLNHWAVLVLSGAGDGKYFERLGKVTTRHENVSANSGNREYYPQQNSVESLPRAKNMRKRAMDWLTGRGGE